MCAYLHELAILCPEIFLGLSACIILMIGVITKRDCSIVINILVTLTLLIAIYLLLDKVPTEEVFAFDNLFKSNLLIKNLKLLVLISSIFYIFLYKGQKFSENSMLKLYEFPVILLFSLTGMLLMLSANNFLSFYISLELQSLCLYVMAAFEREDSKSSEAGLKYFVLGSFASGLLLFGISLIYGYTGNLDFNALQLLLANSQSNQIALGVIIGIIMLLIALFFKISAAPFHMWTPDVYQGSPTIVTAFFATIAKIAAIGFLLRITSETLSGWKLDLQPIFILITTVSLLIGAIGALKQTNIKRLLAYSSIGHVGYMMLAISTFSLDSSVLTYLIIYTSMTLGAFSLIMNVKLNNQSIVYLQDLAGLSKTHPITAIAFTIFMFSLAGIPPFAGFFAKFYVFKAALNAELYMTILIAVIAAVIAAYYYLKIVKIIYLDELQGDFSNNSSITVRLLTLILALFNLCYIFF